MSENREVEQAYGRNLFAQNDVNRSVNSCVKKEHKMTKYDVSEILCLIFLYLCSREDYRYKALTVHKIGIFGCAGLVYTLAADTMSVQSMMAGAGVGGMVILVSRCSPDWLGEGDGWMFVVTGLGQTKSGDIVHCNVFEWHLLPARSIAEKVSENGSCCAGSFCVGSRSRAVVPEMNEKAQQVSHAFDWNK